MQCDGLAAIHDLVALGEAGAFDFLLEPGAEEHMWEMTCYVGDKSPLATLHLPAVREEAEAS